MLLPNSKLLLKEANGEKPTYLDEPHRAKMSACRPERSMPLLKWICRLRSRRPRVVFVDDAPPSPLAGAGQPRAALIVDALLKNGAQVTLLPRFDAANLVDKIDVRSHLKIRRSKSELDFSRKFKSYLSKCDYVIISRPSNMARCRKLLLKRNPKKVRLIYDAEALFAKREQLRRQVNGSDAAYNPDYENELGLAQLADTILSVSDAEAEAFRAAGHADVRVLSYASPYTPAETGFGARDGFLFVGPVHDRTTPNADSLTFFTEQVFPRIRAALPAARLVLAGQPHPDIPTLTAGVCKLGVVANLSDVYDQCRVFIAPTRFAAGIPLKAIDAAAGGIPIVMTSVLAQQLEWRNGEEALIEDDAEGFAKACIMLHSDEARWLASRHAAASRVRRDFDRERFDRTVAELLRPTSPAPRDQASSSRHEISASSI